MPSRRGGSFGFCIGQSSHRPCGDSPAVPGRDRQPREQLDAAGVAGQRRRVVQQNDTAIASRTDVRFETLPGRGEQAGEAGSGGRRSVGRVRGEDDLPAGAALLVDDLAKNPDELGGDVDRRRRRPSRASSSHTAAAPSTLALTATKPPRVPGLVQALAGVLDRV